VSSSTTPDQVQQLVAKARAAQATFESFSQEQVDAILRDFAKYVYDNGIICSHEQFVLTPEEQYRRTVEQFLATGKVWFTDDLRPRSLGNFYQEYRERCDRSALKSSRAQASSLADGRQLAGGKQRMGPPDVLGLWRPEPEATVMMRLVLAGGIVLAPLCAISQGVIGCKRELPIARTGYWSWRNIEGAPKKNARGG
jgi:acyl-CoA reductase-like NAD-dependent aldehyde dehydrogenase